MANPDLFHSIHVVRPVLNVDQRVLDGVEVAVTEAEIPGIRFSKDKHMYGSVFGATVLARRLMQLGVWLDKDAALDLEACFDTALPESANHEQGMGVFPLAVLPFKTTHHRERHIISTAPLVAIVDEKKALIRALTRRYPSQDVRFWRHKQHAGLRLADANTKSDAYAVRNLLERRPWLLPAKIQYDKVCFDPVLVATE
jgi:hypothetical protein